MWPTPAAAALQFACGEAEHAESKADFIHKMAIAQKEANETDYWIALLFRSEYLDKVQYDSVSNDIDQIQRLLASIIITAKKNRK